MGLLRRLYKCTRNFVTFFLIVALVPGLPPKTHFPIEPITYEPTRPLTGPLAPNTLLNGAERLLEGRLHGPECLRRRGNDIYASQEGELVKINGKHVTHVARFGKPCEPHDPEICGRPLGFDFDTISDSLIVADAYHGLWSVDLKTLRKTQLISPDQVLPGDVARPAKIFNSVAIARNGDIYWTDSASDFDLIDGLNTFLTNPSGRLFHYDRATRITSVLLDRLHFANGLVLSPDESFVVVAETAGSRLRRVHLTGPLAGRNDVFVAGLPGAPDNLSADERGIWVPLVMTFDANMQTTLWRSAGPAPLVRVFALRIIALLELPFRLVHQVLPTVYTKIVLNKLGSFEVFAAVAPKDTTVVRVDWRGEVVSSLFGTDGSANLIAHVLEMDGQLYLGSYANRYLGRVPVPKGLARGDVLFAPKATPTKPTTTTPKPTTTTTPKPTTTTTPKPTTTTTPKPATTTTPKPTTTTPKPSTATTPKATPTTTTTTTPRPTTTTTAAPPTTKASAQKSTTVKPTTTTQKPTTTKPVVAATAKPATKPAAKPSGVPPPPPPPTPEEPARDIPAPQPIEEQHDEPTRPPQPPKMKVIKRGGEQGEF